MAKRHAIPTLSREEARLLLLRGQCLLDPPHGRRCGPAAVRKLIERLGFVQLDSINVLERAHHLTLFARNHAYRHAHLDALYTRGHVFEHWTHDASVLPIEWHGRWHHKRAADTRRLDKRDFLKKRIGKDAAKQIDRVLERIREQGPMRAGDFESDGEKRRGGWWNWKPAKAVLEYLYWRGDLCVVARPNFHKVYDLAERHVAAEHRAEPPTREAFVAFAVRAALERLGVATPSEVAGFLLAISVAEARVELKRLVEDGEAVAIDVEGGNKSFALPDCRSQLRKARSQLAKLTDEPRLLAPFDPIARDRKRMLRLFDFDYRFEAFTPAADRVHGYYVLPVLQKDRLIGRVDLKHDRSAGVLRVLGEWPEPGEADRLPIDEALSRLAGFIGASSIDRRG